MDWIELAQDRSAI